MSDEISLLGWLDGVELAPATRQRLRAFGRDVLRFNRSQNLISRQSSSGQLNAMIWEAVAASEILAPTKLRSLDLGSGAGFRESPSRS